MELPDQRIYRFGDVVVDPSQRSVTRQGQEQHLRPQAFQLLLYLLQNPTRLVTKEELIENIWKLVAVTDDALVQVVGEIRKAVGDDSRKPHFIKTVPKSGYRFIGAVEEVLPNESLEIEEVMTLEVEMEEEIETPAIATLQKEQKALPVPVSSSRRKVFLIAAVLCIAGLATLIQKFSDRTSETKVPHVIGKKPVVVMFFDNSSGNPELNWLREGLADMLITGLSRSNQLTLLSRQQLHLLLERVGHQEAKKIRLDEALQVAKKSGAEVIILGSFTGIGEQIRIDVHLHDAKNGQLLSAEQLTVEHPQQILTQIDFLSFKLASNLGAAPAGTDAETSLSNAMTNNLEAYRYYSMAVSKAQALHNKEAIELLEKAIALDPQFAMAHARIGYAYAVTWNLTEKAKPHLEKAFQLANRLTELDRLYITAWYAIANLDYPSAIKSFRAIIIKNPSDVEVYLQLGRLLNAERQDKEAIEVFRRGLLFDPESKEIINVLGGLYSTLDRHNDAIAMHQWYVALAPKEANAHDSLGASYQWAGRYGDAIQEYNRALELDPDFEVAVVHLGNTYFQMGRYQDAIHEYERYIKIAPSDSERSRGYNMIAHVCWKRGNLDQAEVAAQKALEYNPESILNSVVFALKRDDGIRSTALPEQFSSNHGVGRGGRPEARIRYFIQGLHEFKNGQTTESVESFKEAIRNKPPAWNIDAFEDCLANAYLRLGRLDEAIAEYERILQLNPNYPLAHYHLAQAYERKGMQNQARDAYKRFLEVWKDADLDLPEIKIAQKKLS